MAARINPLTGLPIESEPNRPGEQTQLVERTRRNPLTGRDVTYQVEVPFQPEPDFTDDLTDSTTLADFGKSIMSGGAGVGAGLGWLLKQTGIPGVEAFGREIETLGNDAVDYWNDSLSDAAKNELAKEFVTRDENGEWQWGDASLTTVGLYGAQSLLGTAAGMGAGAGITKVLQLFGNPVGRGALVNTINAGRGAAAGSEAAVAATAAAKKLKLVDRVLGATGFGLGEGGVGGMMTGMNVEEQVRNLDLDKLMSNPRFMEIYESNLKSGVSDEAALQIARDTVASESATVAGYQAGLTTALLGAPMGAFFGPLFSKAGIRGATRMRATGIGAAGEAAQEFAQSGFEAYTSNEALIAAGDTIGIWDDVLNQAVGGMLAGGLMGGAFGFAAGADPEASQQRRVEKVKTQLKPLERLGVSAIEAGVPKEEIDKVIADVPQGGIAAAAKQLRELIEAQGAEAPAPTVDEALTQVEETRPPAKKGKRGKKKPKDKLVATVLSTGQVSEQNFSYTGNKFELSVGPSDSGGYDVSVSVKDSSTDTGFRYRKDMSRTFDNLEEAKAYAEKLAAKDTAKPPEKPPEAPAEPEVSPPATEEIVQEPPEGAAEQQDTGLSVEQQAEIEKLRSEPAGSERQLTGDESGYPAIYATRKGRNDIVFNAVGERDGDSVDLGEFATYDEAVAALAEPEAPKTTPPEVEALTPESTAADRDAFVRWYRSNQPGYDVWQEAEKRLGEPESLSKQEFSAGPKGQVSGSTEVFQVGATWTYRNSYDVQGVMGGTDSIGGLNKQFDSKEKAERVGLEKLRDAFRNPSDSVAKGTKAAMGKVVKDIDAALTVDVKPWTDLDRTPAEQAKDFEPQTLDDLFDTVEKALNEGVSAQDTDSDAQAIYKVPSENWLSDNEQIHEDSIRQFRESVKAAGWQEVGHSRGERNYAYEVGKNRVEVYKSGKGMGWNVQLDPPEADWKRATQIKTKAPAPKTTKPMPVVATLPDNETTTNQPLELDPNRYQNQTWTKDVGMLRITFSRMLRGKPLYVVEARMRGEDEFKQVAEIRQRPADNDGLEWAVFVDGKEVDRWQSFAHAANNVPGYLADMGGKWSEKHRRRWVKGRKPNAKSIDVIASKRASEQGIEFTGEIPTVPAAPTPEAAPLTFLGSDIVSDQDFGDLELTEEVEVAETGEVFTVTEEANIVFKQAVKRRDNLQKLWECVNG